MNAPLTREDIPETPNPLGVEGIEFIEYRTPAPQALGHLLEMTGFRPIARHRSREILLYRQGRMNIVIDAHALPPGTPDTPQIGAIGLRTRDAGHAWRRVVELGAWPLPVQIQPMELYIPGVHGVGASRIYFVDRWREFSVWDVDFVPIPGVAQDVPALAGLHWFGVVQYVGVGRAEDWCAFYGALFGFTRVPDDQRFGILPSGDILRSPCGTFHLQLIEPPADVETTEGAEYLQRVAFGTPDVPAAVRAIRALGLEFFESATAHPTARGALTLPRLGGVAFELVHHEAADV